ncbi:HTTM domain-containing protein [Chryseolinea sp. H1M3-3]|uniref:HTTM domain-containing protein n=1 Tax=Chryseolinea sp. H1M3-3 TaxID=3034144 RepID=UPI0023ECF1CC|nr:HTTM domain-containing protein [Chryseolinea sp. H1M3-3]
MKNYLQKSTSAAPLAVFRIALGLLLFVSLIRFWARGWIHELYIEPKYFFPFYGFEFVTAPGEYIYVLFAICALSALMFSLGLFYRFSSIALFLSFTYIELIDKSTYLNHYYFISMICLLMTFLPAHVYFSADAYRNKSLAANTIPQWCIDSIKLFVCMIYFFAGLAKVNSEWLLEAQPLRIWLPSKNDLPIIGWIFNYTWVAYLFCWVGCLYDLSIPFLLLKRSTRLLAYCAVISFHVLTAILFPIGMFPYIMIATALIFFSADVHKMILVLIASLFGKTKELMFPNNNFKFKPVRQSLLISIFSVFFIIQLLMPFRYMMYPDELFWTEEGYRFSWRVMLMEKAGHAQFTIKDEKGKIAVVDNTEFLTPLQEKMMATQPDMILQYAHILRDHFSNSGWSSPSVYVDSYVVLNGRLGKPLIDPLTDLAKQEDSFDHKAWILPFKNEIKGF